MKIALAEDNPVSRNTFLQKLREFENYELLFVSKNGHECLDELHKLPADGLPQVIFMDLEMPEMGGIETIVIAHNLYPSIHFIVLTVFDDDDKIFEAIKAGASGYLLKHEPAAVLEQGTRSVLQFGGAPMSPAIARKALQMLGKASRPESAGIPEPFPDHITDREKQILEHLVMGWDAKRSASALDLSVLTVRKHIDNIYKKLHLNSKAQIMSLAYQKKWFLKTDP